MLHSTPMKTIFVALAINVFVSFAHAQVSSDEAQRRLKERTTSRPSTQPATEVERLREENRRLRERIADLQQEVTTLKQMLGHAKSVPMGPASTQPANPVESANKSLLGRWRGGSSAVGNSYLLQFDPDGTYKQTFIFNSQRETGQYRVGDDGTMEMWNDKWPDEKKHNQYRLTATPDQTTLTPIIVDGSEVKTPRPLVLQRVE